MVALQEKPLTEGRMLMEDTAICFFLTLKSWGRRGQVIGESSWIQEILVINMLM